MDTAAELGLDQIVDGRQNQFDTEGWARRTQKVDQALFEVIGRQSPSLGERPVNAVESSDDLLDRRELEIDEIVGSGVAALVLHVQGETAPKRVEGEAPAE